MAGAVTGMVRIMALERDWSPDLPKEVLRMIKNSEDGHGQYR